MQLVVERDEEDDDNNELYQPHQLKHLLALVVRFAADFAALVQVHEQGFEAKYNKDEYPDKLEDVGDEQNSGEQQRVANYGEEVGDRRKHED